MVINTEPQLAQVQRIIAVESLALVEIYIYIYTLFPEIVIEYVEEPEAVEITRKLYLLDTEVPKTHSSYDSLHETYALC